MTIGKALNRTNLYATHKEFKCPKCYDWAYGSNLNRKCNCEEKESKKQIELPQYLIKYKGNYYISKYVKISDRFITFAEEYNSYDVIIIGKLKDIELTFLKAQEVS